MTRSQKVVLLALAMACFCTCTFLCDLVDKDRPISTPRATKTPRPTKTPTPKHDDLWALTMCQMWVKERLVSPSSVDFVGVGERTHHGDGHYTVYQEFDAANAFGAMLRGTYLCETHYVPDRDAWALDALEIW